jgi:pimeloyl-ACP methyl ester carboxylesterase
MKPTLLLLPGLLCDEALWADQSDKLSDVADCIVTDMSRDDTMSGMAKRILDEAPERFSLCGLSMGGYCALEIMRQAPERVERLALLDTSARSDSENKTAVRRRQISLVQYGDFGVVLTELLPLFIHPDRLTTGNFFKTIQSSALAIGPESFLRQQNAIISRADSRDLLATIQCQTLVMCGQQDALTPPELHHEMAGAIPNATLVMVEDRGHLAPLERPDVATPALRNWLLA